MSLLWKPLLLILSLILGVAPAWAAKSEPFGEVRLSQDQFLSSDFEASEHNQFSFVGAKFSQNLEDRKDEHFIGDVEGQFSPGLPMMSYLNVSQLAWTEEHFSVGRKKLAWSRLDDTWNLGLYQPLFRWNPIAPRSQGLSGLFLESKNSNWGLTMFASFLHIPDQGPGYELKDGNFERINPWFQNPPRYVRFLGQTDQVNYEIQKTQANEIIFNRSFVGQLYLGDHTDGLYLQMAMAHKPAHQLALGFDGYLTPDNKAQILITPKVFYHNLLSSEFSFTSETFSNSTAQMELGMTGLYEKPEAPSFEDNITYVTYKTSSLVSPFLGFKSRQYRAQISYLKVSGGEGELQGGLAPANSGTTVATNAILPMRYPYYEATKVSASGSQNLKKKRYLSESVSYLQGAHELFSQWTLEAELQWGPLYRFNVAANFLKASSASEAQRTLIGQYQNNDDVSFGVSYVF